VTITNDTHNASLGPDEPELIAGPPAPPALAPYRPPTRPWRTRRMPLAIGGAALVLGCALGAGITAVVAVTAGGWSDYGGRTDGDRLGQDNDGRGPRGDRLGPATTQAPAATTPAPATPTPAATTPAPTPSPS
jgi:hypothetical protein